MTGVNRGRGTRQAVLTVLGILVGGPAVAVALWAVLAAVSVSSRLAYLVGVAVAACTVLAVLRLARAPVAPAVAPVDDPDGGRRRGVAELITLEHRLAWGSVDAERFETRVRPLLVQVTAERLRLRHGVDHTREPDRARSIVGDRLWQLMTGPAEVGGAPGPRALRRILDRIERI